MSESSPEEKRDTRAHQTYDGITRYSVHWSIVIAFFIRLVVTKLLVWLALPSLSDVWDIGIVLFPWIAISWLAHLYAKRAVRRAGLPCRTSVETEKVRRTATEFRGRHIEDRRANEALTNTFVGLLYFCAGAFLLAKGSETHSRLVAALCLLGIVFCFVGVIWYFLTRPLPTLRIDERGVFGFQFRVWPRLVRWHKIDELLIERSYDPLRDARGLKVRLRNDKGRALLVLALDEGWRGEQIANEIKGRLNGTATVDETPSILPFPSN